VDKRDRGVVEKYHSTRRHIKRVRTRGEPYQYGRKNTEYREAKRELKHAINRSKRNFCDNLCKQVETNLLGLPYRLVTRKFKDRRPIPGLTLPNRIEKIVNTLFPKMAATAWPAAEGKYEFPEVTEEEKLDQAKKTPSGPDGVLDLVIKSMTRSRPDILRKMYNLCLCAVDFQTI